MKKIIASFLFVLLCSVTFVSCSGNIDKGVLFYQEKSFFLKGTSSSMNGDASFELSVSAPDAEMARSKMRIEYVAPDSLSGLSFSVSDGKISATSGEMSVPVPDAASEIIFGICSMFSIPAEKITDIRATDGKNTIRADDGEKSFIVETDENGYPTEISMREGGEEVILKIESFEIIEE